MKEIIMTGRAGDTGSARLAQVYREVLRPRLTDSFLHRLEAFEKPQPIPEGREILKVPGQDVRECICIPIRHGGVYEALWYLAEAAGEGITVEHRNIPIYQETIEVCELLDVSPYLLESGGYLYLTEPGKGKDGTVIGRTNQTKDRVVIGLEGIRFLNRPGEDAWEEAEQHYGNEHCTL